MQLFPRLLRLMDTAGKKEEPGFPVSTEKKDGNNYEEHENRETLAGLIPLPSGIYYGSSRPACIRPDGKKQHHVPKDGPQRPKKTRCGMLPVKFRRLLMKKTWIH